MTKYFVIWSPADRTDYLVDEWGDIIDYVTYPPGGDAPAAGPNNIAAEYGFNVRARRLGEGILPDRIKKKFGSGSAITHYMLERD